MNSWVFISLLLAHVVGDFYLQNNMVCKQKSEKKIKSFFLYFHATIIGCLSWLLVPSWEFWSYALVITFSHLIIDALKAYCNSNVWCFIIDQILHIGIILLVTFLFTKETFIPLKWINISSTCSIPLLILAWLICLKPTNIFIKLVLEKYGVGISASCTDMKNAGSLIGDLERCLTLIFVTIGQFEAIGFIVAAKSILRFKDTDTPKTEYVLAGTFLSFGIAILIGVLVVKTNNLFQ